MAGIKVRAAGVRDAPSVARLAIRESCRHIRVDCSPAGFRDLLVSMTVRAVEERLRGGQFHYWVAERGEQIIGVCAMRDGAHLYHLFVMSEEQGSGVGRHLWEAARDSALAVDSAPNMFTVNASTFAVPFYARLGFQANGDAVDLNGVRSWPMRLCVTNPQKGATAERGC